MRDTNTPVIQGTFYVMTSQGIIGGEASDIKPVFITDVRYAQTWPTYAAAVDAARVAMEPYPYDKRYWSVMRPAIGPYATT